MKTKTIEIHFIKGYTYTKLKLGENLGKTSLFAFAETFHTHTNKKKTKRKQTFDEKNMHKS